MSQSRTGVAPLLSRISSLKFMDVLYHVFPIVLLRCSPPTRQTSERTSKATLSHHHKPPACAGCVAVSPAARAAAAVWNRLCQPCHRSGVRVFQRITSQPGPCGILWILACHKPGPDGFRFIAPLKASIPESAAYYTTPRLPQQMGGACENHSLQTMVFKGEV